jgi:hypothetical protein
VTSQPNSPSPAGSGGAAGPPRPAGPPGPAGPARLEETLTAWARLLLGAERAEQIAPSLTERIGHLDQISRADLGYDDEPATRYAPPAPVTAPAPATAPEGRGS